MNLDLHNCHPRLLARSWHAAAPGRSTEESPTSHGVRNDGRLPGKKCKLALRCKMQRDAFHMITFQRQGLSADRDASKQRGFTCSAANAERGVCLRCSDATGGMSSSPRPGSDTGAPPATRDTRITWQNICGGKCLLKGRLSSSAFQFAEEKKEEISDDAF